MVAHTEPPPLPRPDAAPESLADRTRALWPGLSERAGALASPAMAFVAVAVVGIFAWSRLGAAPVPPLEMALPTVDPAAVAVPTTSPADSEPVLVVVHVAGAVARPGVYRMAAGDRVGDAVDLAGGPTADADLDRINLAAVVADGAQINVPRRGEAIVAPVEPPTASGATDSAAPIDINTADADLIETLPGVGPSTAAAIIRHREQHGPFRSVAALDEVSGIGPARLEALRDLVTVGGGP
ncbi:MAG: helix-hairpin-helix domain-containing protein [Acidimicrobiales bacterium]